MDVIQYIPSYLGRSEKSATTRLNSGKARYS
jgi:hypothetical protein